MVEWETENLLVIGSIPISGTIRIVGRVWIIAAVLKTVDLKRVRGFKSYTILHLLIPGGVKAAQDFLAVLIFVRFESGEPISGCSAAW